MGLVEDVRAVIAGTLRADPFGKLAGDAAPAVVALVFDWLDSRMIDTGEHSEWGQGYSAALYEFEGLRKEALGE